MKAKLLQIRTSTLLMILILLFTAGWSHGVQAQEPFNCGSAIVQTDKLDYAPGEVALISGSGWMPGETVDLMLFSTNLQAYEHFEMVADAEGNFTGLFYEILEIHLGEEFVLDALGMTSGCEAVWYFTDGNVTFKSSGVPVDLAVTVSYRFRNPTGANNDNNSTIGIDDTEFTIAAKNNTDVNFSYPTPLPYGSETIYSLSSVEISGGTLTSPGEFGYDYKFSTPNAARTVTGSYAVCLEITQQPASQSITYGNNASFSVSADGATSYQWQVSTGSVWGDITGATGSSYSVTKPTVAMSGYSYRVIVNGACGTLISNAASLTVDQLQINVVAENKEKIYGDADPSLTYQFTPALVAGDAFSGALSRVAGENVGTYAIQKGTLALSTNYILDFTAGELEITELTIFVTADDQTKIYGDADPSLTYQFTPALVAGDAFSGALSRVAGENVGTYVIGQGDLALSSNYILDFTAGELEITELTIFVTADDKTKIYGDADPSLTYQFTPALVAGDAFSGALSRVAGENVGTYVIGQGDLALSSNYILDFTAGELEITTASLTITAVDESRQYSDPNPAWAVTYDGFVFGEDENVLGGTLTFTGDGPDSDNNTGPGLYDITPGGLTSSNYSITFVNGVLTITPEDANITYVGDRLVATTGTTELNLRAVIEDIPDDYRGLIENATVSFEVFEDGDLIQTISGDLTLLDGNPRIAVASASFNVNEVSDARTFEIQVVVGGYYYSELETPVVAVVYIPVGDHVTGGGFIIPDDDSAGAYPSDAGSHANFGFNMKYQKKGKIITLQGEMNLVIRHEGQTYQFKSTAPVSLGINNAGEDPTAQLTYLGNLNQGNNNPLLSGVILNVTLTDRGSPGIHNDDIGFTIWNGNDLVYSNQWTGYQTERQLLDGGNLVIHKGGTSDEDIILINPDVIDPEDEGIAVELPVDNTLRVFPNPFRDKLNFRFAPVADAQVRLELFDMTGALVEVVFEGLIEANQPVEVHYVPQLRSTAFLFYRLTIGNEVSTGKVMYQK